MPKGKLCPYCGQPLRIETSIKRVPKKVGSSKVVIKEKNFSSDEAVSTFLADEKLHIKILGEFFKFRGDIFLSPEEFKHTINANIKPARMLASLDLAVEFYCDLFSYTQKRLAEIKKVRKENVFITNLNTVTKFIQQFRREYPGYEPTRD